jgi:Domain of unknown function (DUF4386)
MNNNKAIFKPIGVCYILAFFAYGGGSFMTELGFASSDFSFNKTIFVLGAILMGPIHSIIIGIIGILFLSILKTYNKNIAYTYLSAIMFNAILLMMGTVFLFLSKEYNQLNTQHVEPANHLGMILYKGNFYAYQFGMIAWSVGGLFLTYLLFQEKLVHKRLALWGFIGYAIFIVGCISELFGIQIGVLLSLPGGFFEIIFALSLIFRGFNNSLIEKSVNYS